MLPRKRQRTNPAEAASSSSTHADSATTSRQASTSASILNQMPSGGQTPSSTPEATTQKPKELHKARSWYGSWPRPPKATASTSVAKENIFGGTVKSRKAHDLAKYESRKLSDTGNGEIGTTNTLPNVPETPAMSEPVDKAPATGQSQDDGKGTAVKLDQPASTAEDHRALDRPTTPQRPATSSGWTSWLLRTPFTETSTPAQISSPKLPRTTEVGNGNEGLATPLAQASANEPAAEATKSVESEPEGNNLEAPASASWFGFWSSTATPQPTAASEEESRKANGAPSLDPEDVAMSNASPAKSKVQTPKAGSTWAFWSTDSPKSAGASQENSHGEIAVIGDRSEAHPKPMDEENMSESPSKGSKSDTRPKDIATSGRSTWRKTKRVRPPSMDIETGSPSSGTSAMLPPDSKPGSGTQTPTQVDAPLPKTDSSNKSIAESQTSAKQPPNLLLPSFSSTYHMKENPSILKQVARFLLRTHQPAANHVCRLSEPPKIRKALAIGVHGLFPHTYLRPMIGHPTGTSLRFATLCAEAIRTWADAHGSADCEIEKVALEGEGKISDRVDNLWKLMLNWIDHIRKADLIIIACHSQGVPVSIMLIEKLIDLGIITNARIGVCAMAGVALGPFPSHRSNFFTGSASELWEFGDPSSTNSQRFEVAMRRVLEYGARVTFIGSIDDQVVPMESAVYSPAHHPYIFRAVFIDGRIHAPDFIAHLVGFALKLRNLGISDHGLIRELSIPLAGPLVSGEGHSRIYFDSAVYDLAVTHALETTSTPKPTPVDIQPRGALGGANPYVLPWIMRGVLEEDLVKTELSAETDELLKQFDDWKPTNKALKEVKYRLEAVRSRL